MNMEEQILEFLDGNLSGTEEEELLHRLAVSPERRTLLRQHLQVREMVSSLAKKQYKQVPVALTAGVFQAVTALGYSGPQPVGAPQQVAPSTPVASVPKRTAVRPVMVAMLSLLFLLVGGTTTYLLMDHSGTTSQIASTTQPPTALQQVFTAPSVTTQTPMTGNATSNTDVGSVYHRTMTNKLSSKMTNSATHNSEMTSNSGAVTTNAVTNHQVIPDRHANTIVEQEVVNSAVDQKSNAAINPTTSTTKDIHDPNAQPIGRKNNPLNGATLTGGATTALPLYQFSVRTGGGKVPGSELGYSGSLLELRGTYNALDWMSFTVSLGQFMPYETVAIPVTSSGSLASRDGSQLLKLSPQVQYRMLASAEIGARFSLGSMPLEFSAGAGTDFTGNIIPRASLFTSLDLQDNLLLRVGLEGLAYTNNKISSSLSQAEAQYSAMHPLLIGTMKSKETAGFFGPSIELSWKF
jgi:hypothetical protein